MGQTIENFRKIWQQTTLVQRVLLLTIVLGLAAGAAGVIYWARQPKMSILYAGLAPEEAGKVVEKVRDSGVPFQIIAGGTTVMVPDEKVYSLRLSMANQGLPKADHAGYKILDDEKIGTSPFAQRINYTRAIEGELAKTIQLIDGVSSARVHIVRPESTLFVGKDQQSSATVMVCLQQGRHLTPGNVAAIVHMLSGSVESLNADKVVVVDAQGNLLSSEGGDQLAKGASTFLDYKGQVEDYLARKAQDMLAAALGPNRASVKVDATIDTQSLSTTSETYDPDKKVAVKEEIKSSVTAGPDPRASTGGNKDETTTSEYLVSKMVETKSEVPGKVKSLTIAAFVDLSPPAEGDKDAPKAASLTIADVEGIIQNAIGPLATKDNIKVVNTPFYRPPIIKDPEGDKKATQAFYLDIASRASLGLLVVGALVAIKLLKRPHSKSTELATVSASSATPALGAAAPAGMLSADNATAEQLKARITRALQENPEEVKRLFVNWVESDRGQV